MADPKIAVGSLLSGIAPGLQAFLQQKRATQFAQAKTQQKNLEAQSSFAAEATKNINTATALISNTGLGPQADRLIDTKTPIGSEVGAVSVAPGVEVTGDVARSLDVPSEQNELFRRVLSDSATMLAGGMTPKQTLEVIQPRIQDFVLQKSDPFYRDLAKQIPDVDLRLETYRSATSSLGKVAQVQRGQANGLLESVGGDPGAFTFDQLTRFSAFSNDPKIAAEAIDRWSNVGEVKALSAVNADMLALFGNPATARDPQAQQAVQGQSVEILVGAGFSLSAAREYVKQEFDIAQSGDIGKSEAWKLAKAPEVSRWKSSTGGALAPFYNHAKKILAEEVGKLRSLGVPVPGKPTETKVFDLKKNRAAIRKVMIDRGPSSDVSARVIGAALREEGLIEGGQQFLVWGDYVDWFLDVADKDGNIRPDRIAARMVQNNKFWNETFSDVALIQSGAVTAEDLSAVSPEASLEALSGILGAE